MSGAGAGADRYGFPDCRARSPSSSRRSANAAVRS